MCTEMTVCPGVLHSRDEPVPAWSQPLGVLATAAELCKVIPARSSGVEAEILLNMGMF